MNSTATQEGIVSEPRNPVVASTPFFANRWTIREYADGMYDAAATTWPAVSPGFASFDEAVSWACEQEARTPEQAAAVDGALNVYGPKA